ncbi:hypothetical protein GCM10010317_070790 [Streptomyces mirabilis]|uniref:sensor histidine kinase n=1 Tax=Streptomyces mirabilis TaxID=68239 RepID=UPI00198390DD|nr:histidine kinase dimerization/phospho-acceptor domain-containing protein [Streptomyces mirabilis]GHD67657.1 hypothetical protein GCM10010317_070790 [Streptomyces mirabilis]
MRGPDDELKAMADTFDDVLARLEDAFEAQKRFVANASHGLRTPFTLQQAIVDVALADSDASVDTLRAACLRVRAAGREQERLINALLTLARSQGGLQRSRSSWSAWWPTSSTTPYATTIRPERGVGSGSHASAALTPYEEPYEEPYEVSA